MTFKTKTFFPNKLTPVTQSQFYLNFLDYFLFYLFTLHDINPSSEEKIFETNNTEKQPTRPQISKLSTVVLKPYTVDLRMPQKLTIHGVTVH